MLNMKPYVPSTKVAVRESFDEDLSDDVEDDVFIRDGKSIKAYEEKGLKRPLMAPRRRSSSKPLLKPSKTRKAMAAIFRKRNHCWRYCEPFCYAFAALLVLLLIAILGIFLMALFPMSLQKLKSLFHDTKLSFALNKVRIGFDAMPTGQLFLGEQTPCTQMAVSKVWSKAFTRLSTESPVRTVDINGDGAADIVLGYGVDDSIQYQSESHGGVPKCEIENNGYREMIACEGGILALDGITGNTLWQRWTPSIVFSIICRTDLNNDAQIDCVVSGRGGLVLALNGRNGDVLWHLRPNIVISDIPMPIPVVDLYTVNAIRDLDEDSVPDVVAARVEEHRLSDQTSIAGHMQIISGQTGKIIRTIQTPNREELYVPIQVHTQIDGTEMLLVITGGQNSPGGVYLIPLNTIMDNSKENQFITVIRSESSGFMVPAILVDLNEDNVDDIVVSSFNSTVYAFNGQSYATLWNYTFADSESTSSIVPGHYNNDNITDFMVKYNCGPGFPVYYYSQTQIINGKNGTNLLGFDVLKSGDARVALIGFPSVGKSTLLSTLTKTESEAANYEFTTLTCIPGVIEYRGANIQLLDLPGIIEGAAQGKGRGRQVIAVARTADVVIMMLDATKPNVHRDLLEKELESVGIRLNKEKPNIYFKQKKGGGLSFNSTLNLTKCNEKMVQSVLQAFKIHNAEVLFRDDCDVEQFIDVVTDNRVYLPCLYVYNKIDQISIEEVNRLARQPYSVVVSCNMQLNLDYLLERLWEELSLIRVYTKKPGAPPDFGDAIILRRGVTVEHVCHAVHRTLASQFKYALVWGTSTKYSPQRVGISHVMNDEDVIQIIKK
ncbi:uncharacterized protein LOC129580462 [Sitodiplosis mosellana]|uniref:uncharacterized protein LOC129580462 n=2 Tax=Sitodiplosis mosellana TaxID=263140 RepID=UPI0024438436|nr:uncharacterized protein LOC129580462 [Sitodiplosis mosellana]